MEKISQLGVCALSDKLRAGEVSAREATAEYLDAAKEKNTAVNAYITLLEERALAQAEEIDKRRAAGEELPPLAGIPFGMKDNICTRGVRTTCASKMLQDFVPGYSARVDEKLSAAGAVMLGKLNMDEFAMGSSNENSAFGPVKNPVDPSRVPGGSSGGSAAAVAAGMAAFAIGSDTGGSIRQPASFCGVVGIKPTYGRVSRNGLVAFASSLDQVSPVAASVADCAAVLEAISGHDPKDSTSVNMPPPSFKKALGQDVRGMRIALPREAFGKGLDAGVKDAVLAAARQLERLGASVEEVSMPMLQQALPAYYVISSAEASSNLGRYDGVHYGRRTAQYGSMEELYMKSRTEGFGSEVKRRIMLGTFVLSAGYYDAYYKKALQVRTLIMEEFGRMFGAYDLIMTPTAPTTAYRFGEKSDPMQMYLGDVYTVPANIAGVPAISLPCGQGADGLPIGLQLMAKAFDEEMLVRAAHALEQDGKEGAK